jgi:hypothetical protein
MKEVEILNTDLNIEYNGQFKGVSNFPSECEVMRQKSYKCRIIRELNTYDIKTVHGPKYLCPHFVTDNNIM